MKKITILHTSDTHGYLNEISFQTGENVAYGLSRASSYIKGVKENNQAIVIDTGDTIQGSPLMYFYKTHMESYQNPVAAVMNDIGYDYYVPGNHDFNYGKPYFDDFIQSVNGTFLCGNILKDKQSFVEGSYDILSLDKGLKIAIIGITTNFVPVWEKEEHIRGLVFENAFLATQKIIAEIKDNHNVQSIVLGYHGGFEMNIDTLELESETSENLGMKIFNEIPEIDVILSGHQHRVISHKTDNRVLTQPGANAKYVSHIELTFSKNTHWKLVDVTNKLIDVGMVEPDPAINKLLQPILKDANHFLDENIGINRKNDLEVTDHLSARLHKHKIVDLLNKIQLESSGAQVSCIALGNTSTGFKRNISIRDVLNTYVYPNTLVVVEIDGTSLALALERNATFFTLNNGVPQISKKFESPKLEYYNYDMFSNIEYEIDLRREEGNRITKIIYDGQLLKPTDKVSLVMSSYRFSGGGEFEMYQGLKVIKEIPLDISELIIDYIRDTKEIDVEEEHNIKIVY